MKNIGYERALSLAKQQLSEIDPGQVVENTGVVWNGSQYEIPWLNRIVSLDDCSIEQQIICYHYLLGNGPKNPTGKHIAYKQAPGAIIYDENFFKRTVNPMVKVFGNDHNTFLQLGINMGGTKAALGHTSFTVNVLPYVPITFVLWQGDDEVPTSGNILFDETAPEWFCAEDLVVIASLPVYEMLAARR